MIKNTTLFILGCSYVFFNFIIGYSVKNQSNLSGIVTKSISNSTSYDSILKEFQDYWMEIAKGPHHSSEFSQKLTHIKEIYQPYLEVLQSFSEIKQIEIACSLIFVYEFNSYILKELDYQNSQGGLYPPFSEKVQCIESQFLQYTSVFNIWKDKDKFIKDIPNNISRIPKADITLAPLLKNYIAELTLKAFYGFIDTISTEIKDDSIKNKLSLIKSVFEPYRYIINSLQDPEEITTAIGFIFAYEYGPLLTAEMIGSNNQLKLLYKKLQSYINLIQQPPSEWPFRQYLIKISRWRTLNVCSIIPNPMADDVIQELFEFCKNSSKIFSFDLNTENFEQKFTPHLNHIKSCFSKDLICLRFKIILELLLQSSHFYLSTSDPNLLNIADERPLSYGYHKNNYTYLKITNFNKKFNYEEVNTLLSKAITKNNNIILDLQDNEGGLETNLMYLLSFFVPESEVLGYWIENIHLSYTKNINFKEDGSQKDLEKLVGILKTHCDQQDNCFEITIKKSNESLQKDQQKYEIYKKNYIEYEKCDENTIQYLEKYQDMIFNQGPVVKCKITVLINYNSQSCAELAAAFLKAAFPNRVKLIGTDSKGYVLVANTHYLPNSQLYLTYPIAEIITSKFTRLEHNPVKPDVYLVNPEEIIKIAEEWVTEK